ncbi:YkgJ family cysteine cluster protein [Halomicrobium salinisoli]|uniref:YkgJ family cysteine cluster protein n=1 Tax=Halomicrobium salinisoli TaxID=2878391 RepID=UPI001CEFF6F0|nr:YkgJ family cysteine cluster protein [Halomicrobium salinisoli]
MKVDCEGCAGCCVDWRPLTDAEVDHERRGPFAPLDDTHNLVPLERDEVRAFLRAGHGDALRPRLFGADDPDRSTTVDGREVAAVGDRPVFFVGLRKPPKPVGPFGTDSTWLRTCTFLDPVTLQCRIHGSELYPDTCATYPGDNLQLDAETECERVERVFGGERLLDDEPPEGDSPLLGPAALGSTVFAHPDPGRLDGAVERLANGEPTREDRAEFAAVAGASAPGTGAISEDWYERLYDEALAADAWTGRAIETWERMAAERVGERAPASRLARRVEDADGAPGTPGWD